MALIDCPKCKSEDINGTAQPDSRLLIHCNDCGHEWLRGEARRDPARPAVRTIDALHAAFPTATDVRFDVRERVALLESEFLMHRPEPDPEMLEYRARYQELFSREGLATAPAEELHYFANSNIIAGPGNMSGFNRAWNTLGADKAAVQVRATIEYLLYGPESLRLEDRLTHLIDGKKGLGFPSFKESLLTKVLCVVEPDRFLPILKYSTAADGRDPAGGEPRVDLMQRGQRRQVLLVLQPLHLGDDGVPPPGRRGLAQLRPGLGQLGRHTHWLHRTPWRRDARTDRLDLHGPHRRTTTATGDRFPALLSTRKGLEGMLGQMSRMGDR